MSDFLKRLESIANDPFKAGTGLIKDAINGENTEVGPFGQEGGTNPGIQQFKFALLSKGLQRTNRFLFLRSFA